VKIIRKFKKLFSIYRQLNKIEKILVQNTLDTLKNHPKYADRRCLIPYGYKIYSQNDEDGIINEIFKRIGTTNKIFVEFGIGNGLENNTYALLFDGWRGLWIEGSKSSVDKIQLGLKNTISKGILNVTQAFVTKDNINELISTAINESEIDLISIDIDGNDIHVFNAINCLRARVVVIEYNAKFAPPVKYCMPYISDYSWQRDDSYGASLKYLELELAKAGYLLIGCNITGANAFFVQQELVMDNFKTPYTAEEHYEPARHHLASFSSGRPATFKSCEEQITDNN